MCRHHRELEVLAQESGLAVYQCRHGLLHLRVNRVTLTLKPEEFLRLGGLAARVAVPGEDSGVGFARDDVT